MAITTQEIGSFDSVANAGWVKELILIKKEDILSMSDIINDANVLGEYIFEKSMIFFKADANITKISFVYRSCSWDEELVPTKNGSLYQNQFVLEVAKNNVQFSSWLLANEKREFLCVFKDGNDQIYISGTKEIGFELSYNRSIKNKNRAVVALNANLTSPTFHTIELDLYSFFEEVEFSEEFSNEFNTYT